MLNRRVPIAALLLALGLWGAWRAWQTRSVDPGPGAVAPNAPEQSAVVGAAAEPFVRDGWTLTPVAAFALEARVLGRENYRFDRLAALVPTDLALGWGAMSDAAVLDAVEITQRGRFYFWRVQAFPIPEREIIASSANVHLIPADAAVARALRRVRVGHVLRLRGRLVDAQAADGTVVRSSVRRDDSGPGACELLWVEALDILHGRAMRR